MNLNLTGVFKGDSITATFKKKDLNEYRLTGRGFNWINEYPFNRHWALGEIEDAPTLDALLASVLAKLIQQRLRIGLGRNYANEHQAISGIRGRIDFTKSLKHHTFEHGQAYCDFQQYSANGPKNQIVHSTLGRLIQAGNFGPDRKSANELRHHLRQLTRALDGVDVIELNLDLIHRQQFGRNDGDYRLMLAICELLLQQQMPLEAVGHHPLPTVDRQTLVLYSIYERFVANFYRLHLHGYIVKAQSHLSWHTRQENTYLPIMKPDLMIQQEASGNIIVLDTKFTTKSLKENLWGKQLFDSAHLYQMYAYLNTQSHLSEQHQKAVGVLLYPAIHTQLSERIKLEHHTIQIECLDLTAQWQDVEKQLLDIIAHAKS
jgi:5-methylcytosine-specific restriction enzyme subunit McrC